MKLFTLGFSPSCQKVIALADEVGLPLDLVEVDIFKGASKTPEFLAKNPNGKVPVLVDGDFVLWESNAMLPYLAQKANRLDLSPTTPQLRADVERWLTWSIVHFEQPVRRVAFQRIVKKLAGLGPSDESVVETASAELHRFAAVLDDALKDKEFLCGHLTIADFGAVTYAALCKPAGLDLSGYRHLSQWLSRMLERPSLQRTLSQAA